MSWNNLCRLACVAFFVGGVFVAGAFSQAPSEAELRASSRKLMNDGNFNDAYQGFRKLCLDPKSDKREVTQDLSHAVQCLYNLGRVKEFDELVESTIAVHKENWRVLWTAAQQYMQTQHQGFMIAGVYERGPHRGGGEVKNSVERDRVRSLQLMQQAMPLANKDDNKNDVSTYFRNFGEMLLNNRGHYEAWRLQYLSDLTKLPDYDDGYFAWREYNGAPVDAEGKPVYHTLPKSWETAETDGQRWRWVLFTAIENSPNRLNQVRFQLAQFFEMQFGVQSMAMGGFRGRGFGFGPTSDDDTKKDESGTFALHTLKETETIAKLANGIKRFDLPDEFNHIKLYQQIIAEPKTGMAEQSYQQLSEVFANRRQYPRAAEYWKENIAKFGPGQNNWKQEQLNQIIGNWGQFDGTSSQPAGKGATVGFTFRNGKRSSSTPARSKSMCCWPT
jgi:hypothetical protein